jgi:hypothetical protein
MIPTSLFPILLVTHIALAITLFLPTILLPFAYRPSRLRGGRPAGPPGRVVRALLRLQGSGSVVVGIGLALSGAGLLSVLGVALLAQPWLLTALALYATTMLVAWFVQRPALRSIVGLTPLPEEIAAARARRARYVSYLMGAVVGTIGVLMSGKPQLW